MFLFDSCLTRPYHFFYAQPLSGLSNHCDTTGIGVRRLKILGKYSGYPPVSRVLNGLIWKKRKSKKLNHKVTFIFEATGSLGISVFIPFRKPIISMIFLTGKNPILSPYGISWNCCPILISILSLMDFGITT